MDNYPQISVIVPIYNSEKYLQRCIDSILAQTYTNIELLLIDDGSTDKSGIICDQYAQTDNRIKVFHKKNGGVASTRQLGIEKAMGEYSIHVDSDDWIETKMLEEMYKSITRQQADVLISDFYDDKNGITIYNKQHTSKTSSTDILKEILKRNLFGALWHKLIRHSLYKEYNIHFIPNINYCEDVLILAQLLQQNIKVAFLHKAYYHYCHQNQNSITKNYDKNTFHIRQQYVIALQQILPTSFDNIKHLVAYEIKREGFSHDFFNRDEFYQFMPDSFSLHNIFIDKCGKTIKISILFAYWGYYESAQKVLKKLRKISNILKNKQVKQ